MSRDSVKAKGTDGETPMRNHYHSQDRRDMIRGLDLTGETLGHRHTWNSWKPDEPTGEAAGHAHLVGLGLTTGWMLLRPIEAVIGTSAKEKGGTPLSSAALPMNRDLREIAEAAKTDAVSVMHFYDAWSPDRAIAALDVVEAARDVVGRWSTLLGYLRRDEPDADLDGVEAALRAALAKWDALESASPAGSRPIEKDGQRGSNFPSEIRDA